MPSSSSSLVAVTALVAHGRLVFFPFDPAWVNLFFVSILVVVIIIVQLLKESLLVVFVVVVTIATIHFIDGLGLLVPLLVVIQHPPHHHSGRHPHDPVVSRRPVHGVAATAGAAGRGHVRVRFRQSRQSRIRHQYDGTARPAVPAVGSEKVLAVAQVGAERTGAARTAPAPQFGAVHEAVVLAAPLFGVFLPLAILVGVLGANGLGINQVGGGGTNRRHSTSDSGIATTRPRHCRVLEKRLHGGMRVLLSM